LFKRIISFLVALFVSAPADAKQSLVNPVDVTDIEARIGRAQEIIEKLDRPIDYGGVTRDKTGLNKMAWAIGEISPTFATSRISATSTIFTIFATSRISTTSPTRPTIRRRQSSASSLAFRRRSTIPRRRRRPQHARRPPCPAGNINRRHCRPRQRISRRFCPVFNIRNPDFRRRQRINRPFYPASSIRNPDSHRLRHVIHR
jgi:hypothetical protein